MAHGKRRGASVPRKGTRRALALPLIFIAGLAALGFLNQVRAVNGLMTAFGGATVVLLTWWAVLVFRASGRKLGVETVLRPQHYLQAIAHCSIFVYWGLYWPPIREAAPLIAAQIVFAYAFDMLLVWSRRDRYTFGFGPFPIIFSTNLFLRFHDEWFFWQFVMIAIGFLAKELIRWERDGRRVHIFNPSSFPLAAVSLVLIATKTTGSTWGIPIATELFLPPHIYLFIFLVSLPGQFLFGVTTMTLSAVLTTYAFSVAYFAATGTYFFIDNYIPIAVFLGMHLLFTDPSTAPRTELGRIMFGVMYGLSVVGLYAGLSWAGLPAFYDKLLQVPIMNLMVRAIDRAAGSSAARWFDPGRLGGALQPWRRRLVYTSLWVLVFGAMTAANGLGDSHPGHMTRFWQQACRESLRNGCAEYDRILTRYCGQGSGWACNEIGVLKVQKHLIDNSGADVAFQRACALGFSTGCGNRFAPADTVRAADPLPADYVWILSRGKGPLMGLAPEDLLDQACRDGWMAGCDLLGAMKVSNPAGTDKVHGAQLLQRACDGGNARGCADLGLAYRNGDGVPRDPVKALDRLKRACDLGMSEACLWLQQEKAKSASK